MKSVYLPFGSISHGTMRSEDLIPAYISALESLHDDFATSAPSDFDTCEEYKRNSARITDKLADIEARMIDDEGDYVEDYFDSDEAGYDLESLDNLLNEFCPPYAYFGAHPGDGSDFGVWLSESFADDFDGLKVSDTSEIPADYTGEVLQVSDHGNPTLYSAQDGTLTEVWALV